MQHRLQIDTSGDDTDRKRPPRIRSTGPTGRPNGDSRALVANAFDGIAVVDADGQLTFASPPLCKLLGVSEPEILGRPGLTFVEVADGIRMRSTVLDGGPGGEIGPITLRLRTVDGAWLPFEGYRTDLTDDPDVQGIVWNLRDRVRTALGRSGRSARARSGCRPWPLGSSDVTVVNDRQGFAIYAGPSMERVFGYRAGRVRRAAPTTPSSTPTICPAVSPPPPRPLASGAGPGRPATGCATPTARGGGSTPGSPTCTTIRPWAASWPTSGTSPTRPWPSRPSRSPSRSTGRWCETASREHLHPRPGRQDHLRQPQDGRTAGQPRWPRSSTCPSSTWWAPTTVPSPGTKLRRRHGGFAEHYEFALLQGGRHPVRRADLGQSAARRRRHRHRGPVHDDRHQRPEAGRGRKRAAGPGGLADRRGQPGAGGRPGQPAGRPAAPAVRASPP